MLEIEDLWVDVEEKEVLKGVKLQIPQGETHILFGKNGSGKSTLLMTIMGFARYRVKQGRIAFSGRDITHLPVYERARLGLGLAFQRPPVIRGVTMRDLLRECSAAGISSEQFVQQYNFSEFLDRDVNYGFSGGELKRSELLQLLVQDPLLVLLDEPESGVDLESLQLVGEIIGRLLQKECRCEKRQKSGFIISHTGFILDYIHADRGYVLSDGQIRCFGHPLELLSDIKNMGYEECIQCQR
ncbi:ABC transporter ATP-binding protein [Desulfoferrobacter suflitae]|uniref:ABC transporter ATP-binding protein n=1 Tax=Desulfoferrobacter suflitae TaxID=2865782 RepID=UPI00216413CC|nr:ABC transporter ATP-binding protein [Desulfoferrobacter suflitae]MCK8603746.1 ABC transporter ATP-binding protein [Desulfoferrobacter suflitae]